MFSGNNSRRVFGRRKETIQDTRSREDYEDFSLNFFKKEIDCKYEFVFDFLRGDLREQNHSESESETAISNKFLNIRINVTL